METPCPYCSVTIYIYYSFQLWECEQQSLLSCLSRTGAQLAGDSRVDSPGYSAKYGTYSLLDTSLNRIIDMQLVQVRNISFRFHL